MQEDSIVSHWLSGADDVSGLENPAGPLYIYGEAVTRTAMSDSNAAVAAGSSTLLTCVFPTKCC